MANATSLYRRTEVNGTSAISTRRVGQVSSRALTPGAFDLATESQGLDSRFSLGLTLSCLCSKSASHQGFAFCIKCNSRSEQRWVILDDHE